MKTTPLRARHEALGARFIPFAGFEMPVQFEGILAEHDAVRKRAGFFDVSHMSNLELPPGDAEQLARAVAADVTRLGEGRAKYTVCLREDGTILDDLIIFRLPDRFHIVPNAGMNEVVASVLREAGCTVADNTFETCILAVQGPDAPRLVADALGDDHTAKRFHCHPLGPDRGFVAGTGYTGEAGVEFFVPVPVADDLVDRLVKAGVTPCGLGARDTLRLEKGYCLAGNEFDPPVTPVEANLLWTVDLDHEFRGRDAVLARREAGPTSRLAGIQLTDKGIPRRGCEVFVGNARVGRVSSGTMSPSLGAGIALAYVDTAHADVGTAVGADVRGRRLAGKIAKVPFL